MLRLAFVSTQRSCGAGVELTNDREVSASTRESSAVVAAHPARARVALGLYYLSLATLFVLDILRLGPFSGMVEQAVALLVFLGASLSILGRAVFVRDRPSLMRATVALVVASLAFIASEPASVLLYRVQWSMRRPILDSLVRDVLTDPRVRSLSSGTRYHKDLNGTSVRDLGGDRSLNEESDGPAEAVPVAAVQRRDGISVGAYQRYRSALVRAGYLSLEVQPGYVVFTEDGMIDNEYGVLYVRPGHAPPRVGAKLGSEQLDLISLQPLGGGWYAFATT